MRHRRQRSSVAGVQDPPAELAQTEVLEPVRQHWDGRATAAIHLPVGFGAHHWRIEVGGGPVERTTDEVVASVFSLSSSTPHLFGDRRPEFERELRGLLDAASPAGVFSEQMRGVAASVWRA